MATTKLRRSRSPAAAAVLGFCTAAAPFSANAEVLVFRCHYHPLPGEGRGQVRAPAKHFRTDVIEIDVAARRAVGASRYGPDGRWRNVVVRHDAVRLWNGHADACEVSRPLGEVVTIDRRTGRTRRSECVTSNAVWLTSHWSGICESLAGRAR